MLPGRQWRSLQDTTNDPIINHHHPRQWTDWTRNKDYYDEGVLIWLDADTLIRERSHDARSLDDFARAFFGIDDGSTSVVTYTFDDVVKALNAVEPYDWAAFLRQRLDAVGVPAPLDGIRRGGYRLVYTDKPSDFQKQADGEFKLTDLSHSIGVIISDKDGSVLDSSWGGPAFKAGLTPATQILAVNGIAYDADVLCDAIRAAKANRTPIELMVKLGDRYRVTRLEYYDGLRYPHSSAIRLFRPVLTRFSLADEAMRTRRIPPLPRRIRRSARPRHCSRATAPRRRSACASPGCDPGGRGSS